jgi:tRNA-specific 2-thiouridylase
LRIFARVRSSQPPQPARLFAEADGTATVVLENGEDGVAVGQACVFYASGAHDARVLGGGFIARTIARQAGAAKPPELSRAAFDG